MKVDLETRENALSILTNKTQAWKCKHQSRQQLLFNICKSTALQDAMGYVFLQYSYAAFKIFSDAQYLLTGYEKEIIQRTGVMWSEKNILKKMKILEQEFFNRNLNTLKSFKTAVAYVPRDVWNCGSIYINDDSYTALQNVFQKYVINEVDLNEKKTCKKDCPTYSRAKVYGCYDGKMCAHQRTCDGTLWDCDDKLGSAMKVCASDDQTSRYRFIEANGQQYGQQKHCENLIEAKTWRSGFYKCSYCLCTCDNSNISGDRYFNLRPAASNMDLNHVVTSARFRKENNVIHIQIQQGELLQDGVVNRSTINWKPIDNYTINNPDVKSGKDYHTISWNERTICLDELDSPKKHVLTGLRFKLIDGYLKLEIRVTPFNFTTGKLSPENSYWYSNNADFIARTELKLDDYNEEIINLKSDQYLRFTTSDLKIDAGQSTIPYIDVEEVPSILPVPLSGAGIFHKKPENIGHVLTLKLLTYNFEPHINV